MFSVNDIENQLKLLNTHKVSGPDCIPAHVLHHCATEIAPLLTVIFTQSLDPEEVPPDWLRAYLIPIFKKGDKHNPLNYHPISLKSICWNMYNVTPS